MTARTIRVITVSVEVQGVVEVQDSNRRRPAPGTPNLETGGAPGGLVDRGPTSVSPEFGQNERSERRGLLNGDRPTPTVLEVAAVVRPNRRRPVIVPSIRRCEICREWAMPCLRPAVQPMTLCRLSDAISTAPIVIEAMAMIYAASAPRPYGSNAVAMNGESPPAITEASWEPSDAPLYRTRVPNSSARNAACGPYICACAKTSAMTSARTINTDEPVSS
jgi:hypothetical protein